MSRLRLAAVAAMLSCGLMLVAGTGVASARSKQETPQLTQVVALSGTVTKGGGAFRGKEFTGTYTIERFVRSGEKLYAVGTVDGKVRNKRVHKENVRVPATLANAGDAQASQIPPTPNACRILSLQLGPIDLNVLGLRIRTNQINLLIEGVRGPGNLLGNLLCGITGALDPNTLAGTPLGQLAQILNALVALSPRTA